MKEFLDLLPSYFYPNESSLNIIELRDLSCKGLLDKALSFNKLLSNNCLILDFGNMTSNHFDFSNVRESENPLGEILNILIEEDDFIRSSIDVVYIKNLEDANLINVTEQKEFLDYLSKNPDCNYNSKTIERQNMLLEQIFRQLKIMNKRIDLYLLSYTEETGVVYGAPRPAIRKTLVKWKAKGLYISTHKNPSSIGSNDVILKIKEGISQQSISDSFHFEIPCDSYTGSIYKVDLLIALLKEVLTTSDAFSGDNLRFVPENVAEYLGVRRTSWRSELIKDNLENFRHRELLDFLFDLYTFILDDMFKAGGSNLSKEDIQREVNEFVNVKKRTFLEGCVDEVEE